MNTVQKKIYLYLSVCLSASPSVLQHFRLSVILTVCCQCLRLSVRLFIGLSNSSSVFSVSFRCLLSVSSSVCQPVIFHSALPLSVRQHHRLLSVSPPACQPICLSALHLTVYLSSVCLSVCTFACLSV